MNKRYDTTSALIRYIAGVFSLVAFVLLFGTIIKTGHGELKFAEVFFGANGANTCHPYGFVAQVLILLAGIFGVLIPIIGVLTDNEKTCSYICGGVLVACGVVLLLMKVLYAAISGATDASIYSLSGTVIAAACLAIVAGGFNVWAAFIKE